MNTCYLMLLVFCWDNTLFQLYRGSRKSKKISSSQLHMSRQGYMCPPNHLPYDSDWFVGFTQPPVLESFQLRFWKILLPAHFALLETWISWVEPFGLRFFFFFEEIALRQENPVFFLGKGGGNLRIFYFVACCLLFVDVLSFKFSSRSCGKN